MIVEEKNPKKEERIKIKKILEMVKDVKLPKGYRFAKDCVELHEVGWFGYYRVADLGLLDLEDDTIIVHFEDERYMRRFRKIFDNSQTKFKFVLNDWYY